MCVTMGTYNTHARTHAPKTPVLLSFVRPHYKLLCKCEFPFCFVCLFFEDLDILSEGLIRPRLALVLQMVKADFVLSIILPPFLKCWNHRLASPDPVYFLIFPFVVFFIFFYFLFSRQEPGSRKWVQVHRIALFTEFLLKACSSCFPI